MRGGYSQWDLGQLSADVDMYACFVPPSVESSNLVPEHMSRSVELERPGEHMSLVTR